MEMNNGYNPIKYDACRHRTYLPIDNNRYTFFTPYNGHHTYSHENILVNYIAQNIYKRTANMDPSGGGIEDLFKDRLGLIRSKIELILLLLEERKRINQEVIYQINQDHCSVQSMIFERGKWAYVMDRDRIFLERMKLDLEEQKRREEVSLFKDTGLLNKDLKDALIQYLSDVQKSKFISVEEEK